MDTQKRTFMLAMSARFNSTRMNAAVAHSPEMAKIIKNFKKNTLSVEIVKDNCLQKVNFRVKDKVRCRASDDQLLCLHCYLLGAICINYNCFGKSVVLFKGD